jgi:hypothetical protein
VFGCIALVVVLCALASIVLIKVAPYTDTEKTSASVDNKQANPATPGDVSSNQSHSGQTESRGTQASPPDRTINYFPLDEGAEWKYEIVTTTDPYAGNGTEVVRTLKGRTLNGKEVLSNVVDGRVVIRRPSSAT